MFTVNTKLGVIFTVFQIRANNDDDAKALRRFLVVLSGIIMALGLSSQFLSPSLTFLGLIPYVSTFSTNPWCPSRIELDRVSHSYPESLWRTLTSSVPRREFAIDNLSLTLESELFMLLGASSSGKTTLLKLILGTEDPTFGTISISTKDHAVPPALPILLDERPKYGNSQQRTVDSILKETIRPNNDKKGEEEISSSRLVSLVADIADVLKLSLDQKAEDLSPSETYRCRLAEACLQSMLWTCSPLEDQYPAPILLLDEWMDTETSTVVQNVQPALKELANRGAIVVTVTHKSNLYRNTCNEMRCITLNRGSILSF